MFVFTSKGKRYLQPKSNIQLYWYYTHDASFSKQFFSHAANIVKFSKVTKITERLKHWRRKKEKKSRQKLLLVNKIQTRKV